MLAGLDGGVLPQRDHRAQALEFSSTRGVHLLFTYRLIVTRGYDKTGTL